MSSKPPVHGRSIQATESMQLYAALPQRHRAGHPGLVLLYADEYESLPPAFVLRERGIILGRQPGVGVHLPVKAVSRQHAALERRGDRWLLKDLGGRNGTMLNGEFVDEAALTHLDVIRVGDAILKFVESGAEGYCHYRIDGAYLDNPASGKARTMLSIGRIVGGFHIRRIAEELRAFARSELSVMILGESGTGKEVFAQQLHDWSGRRGAMQAVNCAAIPASLIEGELFGHRRGAFSGADRDYPGLIRSAHGGTLFLDEIGDMPLEAQAKLLRVIQSKEVVPLGATQPERVDVRIVCATHRDVGTLQKSGAFRGDLFARLNELSVTLPPLRERKEDIYPLCTALAARHGKPEARVTLAFMMGVLHYDFPYNIRELEALIKRWAAVPRGPELDAVDLSDEIKEQMSRYGLKRLTPTEPVSPPAGPAAPDPGTHSPPAWLRRDGTPTEQELRAILAEHHGNVAAVGRLLRKDRVQVHRWMKRYGIDVNDYR